MALSCLAQTLQCISLNNRRLEEMGFLSSAAKVHWKCVYGNASELKSRTYAAFYCVQCMYCYVKSINVLFPLAKSCVAQKDVSVIVALS